MGASNVTLKTIAERLGCSDSTVSRVLSGKARQFRISEKLEQDILRLARELNFVPNPLAASLRTRRTMTVGLAVPRIANPFFAEISSFVQHECRKAGYSVLLADTEENSDIEKQSVALLHMRNIDGLIIAPVGRHCDHLAELYEGGLPIVLIDRFFPEKPIPYVASDNYRGAFEAVTFLIENGHRKIACVQGPEYAASSAERVRGYCDALKHSGLQIDEDHIVGDSFSEENGYFETRILLKDKNRPTALLALSNLIALGALRAIHEEHLRVPDDISIIAFDDQPYFSFLAAPMTTVAQQTREIGRIAIKLLLQQMTAENSKVESVTLPTMLIRRGSVKRI